MASSAVPTFKLALFSLCETVFANEALVTYGHPGKNIPNDIVAVRNAVSTAEWAAVGAQRRQETIEQTVIISCYTGDTNQRTVTERAYDLLDLLDAELRKPAGDPSIGGACQWAAITSHELLETEPGTMDKGRIAEVQVTITATVRI